MRIELHKMVAVSNNSPLTNQVNVMLNDKLSDEEKANFNRWMQLVINEHQLALNKSKRFFNTGYNH
jgi:hypothetical protein